MPVPDDINAGPEAPEGDDRKFPTKLVCLWVPRPWWLFQLHRTWRLWAEGCLPWTKTTADGSGAADRLRSTPQLRN